MPSRGLLWELRPLFCLFQVASYRIMVRCFDSAVYGTVIRFEGRRVQDMVDSVEELILVVAEAGAVATAHIGIG